MSKKNVLPINEATSTPKAKKSISARQLAANRANGAKSHGPATDQGKTASRTNALKHHLCGSLLTLEGEERDDYERFKIAHFARFDPRDELEVDLCEKMAHASWRINRAAYIEAELLDLEIDKQKATLDRAIGLRPPTRLALAFKTLTDEGNTLSTINRYESALVRQYASYQRMYAELRKRNDLPPENLLELPQQNEPIPNSEHHAKTPEQPEQPEVSHTTDPENPTAPGAATDSKLTTDHCPLPTNGFSEADHWTLTTDHSLK
jgi:hypothetical protein